MNSRVRDYFDLIRAPNLFTAAADVLGGALYLRTPLSEWPALVTLAWASMCLYAGGAALNDVCDVAEDARERPTRPIPAGRISRREAAFCAVALLAIGVIACGVVSLKAGAIGISLVSVIVLYNAVFKRTKLGPAAMGLCRSLNLVLGMSLQPLAFEGEIVFPACLMWLYVASLTVFARHEAVGGLRPSLWIGTAGVAFAFAALGMVQPGEQISQPIFFAMFLTVAIFLAGLGVRAARQANPDHIQRTVRVFVLFIVVFDACLAFAGVGLRGALITGSLLIPAVLLAARLRVT